MENEWRVKYTPGSSVRILPRERLQELSRGSKYRLKIEDHQLAYAGQVAMVKWYMRRVGGESDQLPSIGMPN